MARRISPEYILPLRFTLHVPADTSIQFSVLDFPYGQALNDFTRRLENIYQHQHGTKLPFEFYPPDRQLNDAVLTLAPGLIQGFESPKNPALKRMVAFTRFENGRAEDFPTLEDLTSLIRIWLERWAMQPAIQDLLEGDSKAAWQTLMDALDGSPEADWRHGITPDRLAADPGGEKGLAFLALPALLTALLHDRTQIIERSQGAFPITWRRANDGGKDGLHLVSQPMSYRDDYFAYRLDFSVETQAGYGGGGYSPAWASSATSANATAAATRSARSRFSWGTTASILRGGGTPIQRSSGCR